MFKFLRKYNKYILAVGGTLLLITFLIPFAFQNLLPAIGRGGAAWASVGTEKQEEITARELTRIQRELQLLQVLQASGLVLRALGPIERPEHWYLLDREADSAGLTGGPSSVSLPAGSEQLLAGLVSRTGEGVQFIRETLAKVQGVERMIDLYLDRWTFSDRRLQHHARRMYHVATAQFVVVEASKPRDPPAFGDQEITEQMAKYAEDPPGEGEKGFGYRLPHRAKLEWLAIRADTVREMIEGSDQLNPVALRKHWRLNALLPGFGKPEPGAEVPEAVRSHLLNTLTDQTLDEIAKYANDRLRIKRRGLDRRGGYLELPEGWQGPSFEDLALDIQQKFTIALPEYHASGDRWLESNDLADLFGIGRATSDKFGQTPVTLGELVIAAKEFGGSSTILIQQGVAGPPLRGEDASVYLFRIIDADPSRPPRSVDEVRDAVIADLNKLAHYRQLAQAAETIREDAISKGLFTVALAHGATVEPSASLSLTFPILPPKIGPHQQTVEAIIDRAMGLPLDVPVGSLPEDQRTFIVPVEDRLCLLVVRLMDQTPLTEETYAYLAQRGDMQSQLLADELGQDNPLAKAFCFESLAARHNFTFAGAAEAAATEPDATQPDAIDSETDEPSDSG